jgi:hypothetical protein
MDAMRDRSIPVILTGSQRAGNEPLPVWACAAVILSISAGCYYLIFRLIGLLGLW